MQPAQEINAEVLEDDTILFATGAIAVILAGIILYFVTHKGHQEEAEKTRPQKKKKPKAKPKGK